MTTPTVHVDAKPHLQDALNGTWRKTREHYQAQLWRLLSIVGGLIVSQMVNDIIANKPLFDNITDRRSLLAYLVGVGYLAYKQWKPSLNAKQVDQAPGVTIVPEQVGASTVETTEVAQVQEEVEPAAGGEGDAAP